MGHSLQSIGAKIDKMFDMTHDNRENIIILNERLKTHNEAIGKILGNCDLHKSRLESLEKNDLKQKFMLAGATSVITAIITIVGTTKALGLW